jgi:hypothetical protein
LTLLPPAEAKKANIFHVHSCLFQPFFLFIRARKLLFRMCTLRTEHQVNFLLFLEIRALLFLLLKYFSIFTCELITRVHLACGSLSDISMEHTPKFIADYSQRLLHEVICFKFVPYVNSTVKSVLTSTSHLKSAISKRSHFFKFSYRNFSAMRATCTAHFLLLNLIFPIFCKE